MRPLDVQVSGDQMTGETQPLPELPGDSGEYHMMWTFAATRQ